MFMENKLNYIRDFEKVGLLVPKDKGGAFIIESVHDIAFFNIKLLFEEYDKVYQKALEQGNKISVYSDLCDYTTMPGHEQREIIISEHDLLAYRKWLTDYKGKFNNESCSMPDFQTFAIKYLNISKIGTVADRGKKIITTTNRAPHTTFRKWVMDGYIIDDCLDACTYDEEKNIFLPAERSFIARSRDQEKKERLALERKIDRQMQK